MDRRACLGATGRAWRRRRFCAATAATTFKTHGLHGAAPDGHAPYGPATHEHASGASTLHAASGAPAAFRADAAAIRRGSSFRPECPAGAAEVAAQFPTHLTQAVERNAN